MPTNFTHRVNSLPTSILPLNTISFFNINYQDSPRSPIDNCFQKIDNLNLIFVRFSTLQGLPQEVVETQNNLILLGYISAIESYLREIIRRLILIDKPSRISSEEQQLNYGAALNHTQEMLPEAILEKSSFANKTNIIDSFKTFLGRKGHTPNYVDEILIEFEKICHFRHCIVHRFGKFGSSNAIKFGLDKHSKCLEKPIQIDANKLFEVNQVCENTVLVLNDFLFKQILKRTVLPEYSLWKWDFRKDKRLFVKYYNLFASINKPNALSNLTTAYIELRKYKINK